MLYSRGNGVQADPVEAMKWFRKAADQGNVVALYNVGLSYADGTGVAKDLNQARTWMQKAADKGYDEAKQWLKNH